MWGAIIQLALGLGTAGYNAYKQKQTKDKLKGLGDATYEIPQEYFDNLGLAQSEAQTGFSPQTLTDIQNLYAQNLASSNTALQQAGGGVNDYAKMYDLYTDKIAQLGVQDDTLRNQKMGNLLQATSTVGAQKALRWKLNDYDRIRNEKAAAAMMMQNYSQGVNKGINQGIQGAGNLFSYYQGDSLDKEFKDMTKVENEVANKSNTVDLYGNYPAIDNVNFQVGNPSTDIFNTPDVNQMFA